MAKHRDPNVPRIGERVHYCDGTGGSVIARVVHVIYWDVIDIELPDGRLLFGVRRVIGDHANEEPRHCEAPENHYKFRRLDPKEDSDGGFAD